LAYASQRVTQEIVGICARVLGNPAIPIEIGIRHAAGHIHQDLREAGGEVNRVGGQRAVDQLLVSLKTLRKTEGAESLNPLRKPEATEKNSISGFSSFQCLSDSAPPASPR
jgi:hypothetical protein